MTTSDTDGRLRDLDPADFGTGTILITVPHMDDEVLACGGTILKLPDKRRVHLVYCTDGRGILNNARRAAKLVSGEANIGTVRRAETLRALDLLGVPAGNAHFLSFPERGLPAALPALRAALLPFFRELAPAWVLTPFRYDRHPDHVALSHTVEAIGRGDGVAFRMLQYFVYHQWRLLPAGDIRKYVRENRMRRSTIGAESGLKRRALDCFVSQTTCFYPWQFKPVLSDALLTGFANGPEFFVEAAPGYADRDVLRISPALVRAVHIIEPFLKNAKEHTLAAAHGLSRRG